MNTFLVTLYALGAVVVLAVVGLFAEWKKVSKALVEMTAVAARDAAALFNTCAELAGLQKMLADAAIALRKRDFENRVLRTLCDANANAPSLLESQFDAASDAVEAANETIRSKNIEIFNLKNSLAQRKEAHAELAAELEKVRGFQIKQIEFETLRGELANVREAYDDLIKSNDRSVPEMRASMREESAYDLQRRFLTAIDERAEALRRVDSLAAELTAERARIEKLRPSLAEGLDRWAPKPGVWNITPIEELVSRAAIQLVSGRLELKSMTDEANAAHTEARKLTEILNPLYQAFNVRTGAKLHECVQGLRDGAAEVSAMLSDRDEELSQVRNQIARIANFGILNLHAVSEGRFELNSEGELATMRENRNELAAKLTAINDVIASDTEKLNEARQEAREARDGADAYRETLTMYRSRVPGIHEKISGDENFGGRWRLIVTKKPEGIPGRNRLERKLRGRTITPASARRRGAGITPAMKFGPKILRSEGGRITSARFESGPWGKDGTKPKASRGKKAS